jgi:hypothetical protein
MKNILLMLTLCFATYVTAQDRTTVRANNIDISDNLDLRAVASIFGESKNLEDFEFRLNDPNLQISNLDLNNDNQIDYLRVIESIEQSTHLIIIQAVLGRDLFQDVATIEVEKDQRNRTVQVQVVGDVFLYGPNYIYEPVYTVNPIIYTHFWVPRYVVWASPWYWNYYPTYFVAWHPYPIFRYRTRIVPFIHVNNTCHYVNFRRSQRAMVMHQGRRAYGWEQLHPNRSFQNRNQAVSNRYELENRRNQSLQNNENGSRNQSANASVRTNDNRSNHTNTNVYGGQRNQVVSSTRTENTRVQQNNNQNISVVTSENQGSTRASYSNNHRERSEPSVTPNLVRNENTRASNLNGSNRSQSTSTSAPTRLSQQSSFGNRSNGSSIIQSSPSRSTSVPSMSTNRGNSGSFSNRGGSEAIRGNSSRGARG